VIIAEEADLDKGEGGGLCKGTSRSKTTFRGGVDGCGTGFKYPSRAKALKPVKGLDLKKWERVCFNYWMNRLLAVLLLGGFSAQAQTITETFGSGENQFSIDFVTIGNPNYVGDEARARPIFNEFGSFIRLASFGSVTNIYNLGKFEISRDQINKANAAGSLGITLADMSSYGGNGVNIAATGVSWNEAARFVNYLNTSKGYQAAYNFTTSGSNDSITIWTNEQSGYNPNNPYRNRNAYYFLPNVDEWYKAAYGSPDGTYYTFTNGSNIAPNEVANGTSGAVYGGGDAGVAGLADVTNAGGLSPFGTMAQGGNAWEWNESAIDGGNNYAMEKREVRGGGTDSTSYDLDARHLIGLEPSSEYSLLGFRVAMVPEPSSLSLFLAGGAVLMAGRRSRRILVEK